MGKCNRGTYFVSGMVLSIGELILGCVGNTGVVRGVSSREIRGG